MIVNPNDRSKLQTAPGANNLVSTFEVVGLQFEDPLEVNKGRIWTVKDLYSPAPGRTIGGIRARVQDNKGFMSFVNQRDLEVLLGMVSHGSYCTWLGRYYPSTASNDWVGLCVDRLDSLDDLYDRELCLRPVAIQNPLQPGMSITRRVHEEVGTDLSETWVLMGDRDPSGLSPDPRRETIEQRWVRSEVQRVQWATMQ